MICHFRCKETEKVFFRKRTTKFPEVILRSALRKLVILDSAQNLADIRIPPSNRLEKLIGDKKGYYSIRINDRWRICFSWINNNAYDVEILDYH